MGSAGVIRRSIAGKTSIKIVILRTLSGAKGTKELLFVN